MANVVVVSPVEYFPFFNKGKPIFNGFIYIGEIDTDPTIVANQKAIVFVQENGTEVAGVQPVRTGAGGVPTYNGSPVSIKTTGTYSIAIHDSLGSQVYYAPDSGASSANDLANITYRGGSAEAAIDARTENVATYAALQLITGRDTSDIRYVPGVGRFQWDGAAWQPIDRPITPQMFGAVGDNIIDDTAAITSFFAAGGYMDIGGSEFSYKITSQIPMPVAFNLKGSGAEFNCSGIGISESTPIFAGEGLLESSLDGVIFRGGNTTGLGTGSGTRTVMIRLRDFDGLQISNCKVINSYGPSIALQGCRQYRISDNVIIGSGRDGIFTTNSSSRRQENGTITGNTLYRCGDDAITVNGALGTGQFDDQAYNIVIDGNTYIGHLTYHAGLFGRGILVYGAKNCAITNNTIKNTYSFGILIQSDTATTPNSTLNCTVEGNVVADAGIAGDGVQARDGIRFTEASGSSVKNNIVVNAYERGIFVSDVSDSEITGNIVQDSGNDIDDDGISLSADNSRIDVVSNKIFGSQRAGILVGATANTDIVVAENRCYNNGQNAGATAASRAGVRVESTGIVEVKNNSLYNTGGTSTQQHGFSINAAATSVYEGGNICYNNAVSDFNVNAATALKDRRWYGRSEKVVTAITGATPNVANNKYFSHAGGGAVITDFLNGAQGQDIVVFFAGAATLDFSANPNMTGNAGVDFSISAGDALYATLDAAGVWRCFVSEA